jgi:hypothetical protein
MSQAPSNTPLTNTSTTAASTQATSATLASQSIAAGPSTSATAGAGPSTAASRTAADQARKDRTLAEFLLLLDDHDPLVCYKLYLVIHELMITCEPDSDRGNRLLPTTRRI